MDLLPLMKSIHTVYEQHLVQDKVPKDKYKHASNKLVSIVIKEDEVACCSVDITSKELKGYRRFIYRLYEGYADYSDSACFMEDGVLKPISSITGRVTSNSPVYKAISELLEEASNIGTDIVSINYLQQEKKVVVNRISGRQQGKINSSGTGIEIL